MTKLLLLAATFAQSVFAAPASFEASILEQATRAGLKDLKVMTLPNAVPKPLRQAQLKVNFVHVKASQDSDGNTRLDANVVCTVQSSVNVYDGRSGTISLTDQDRHAAKCTTDYLGKEIDLYLSVSLNLISGAAIFGTHELKGAFPLLWADESNGPVGIFQSTFMGTNDLNVTKSSLIGLIRPESYTGNTEFYSALVEITD